MGFTAKFDCECAECGETIYKDEEIFFIDGEKYCPGCAGDMGYVCDCGAYKKPEYDECFECHQHGG